MYQIDFGKMRFGKNFCLFPIPHSSAKPTHIKSSMTFTQNNICRFLCIQKDSGGWYDRM